jgi:hypothetical protein
VIRFQKNAWNEIGQTYAIPVDRQLLIWTESGIPASILAVALRVYELDNPGTKLRGLLTGRAPVRRIPTEEAVLVAHGTT